MITHRRAFLQKSIWDFRNQTTRPGVLYGPDKELGKTKSDFPKRFEEASWFSAPGKEGTSSIVLEDKKSCGHPLAYSFGFGFGFGCGSTNPIP